LERKAPEVGSSLLVDKSPQKPQILRGYLIRLTREYTDGGMDSHAEEEISQAPAEVE